ncbi:MAG: glycoside hydrolase family 13 protein [Muribaculaceae bacterium]|nr:glycoside hydrolase family 13 protein [Muribaculaceae bacterium]
MKTNLRFLFIITVLCAFASTVSAKSAISDIEPPFWWTGMNDTRLQIMVHGEGIRDAVPDIDYTGVTIDSVARLDSKNYQILYVNISPETQPGTMTITFRNGKKNIKIPYELKNRDGVLPDTFSSEDVLYLIMPDRFADGDTGNNTLKELHFPVKVNRNDPNARHGGDLKGIEKNLDYIESLGVTAIWLNPVLENDMPGGAYHGYATTDYYRVDPRFGTNEEYRNLIAESHKRGIKVVMDMIFNHSGSSHPWIDDLPSKDWLNYPDGSKLTNFRLSTINDPYASDYDRTRSVKGWFVPSMPDLNQENPHLMRYLIQNSIWWIEYSKIDGIRMDTYPYADMKPMAQWIADVQKEYPGYNIVGEAWYGDVSGTAYWQRGSRLNKQGDPNLPTVMDFPTMIIATQAFHENTLEYGKGLNKIYNRLSLDYLYEEPKNVLTFLDNHDTDRFLLTEPENLGAWKQGIAFLLTTRGIPQIYYGTELLMHGNKKKTDGDVRKDVPGGFPGDTVNAFAKEGRTALQNEAIDFLSKVANWRKGNKVISEGSLKHFMPENGMYVYERRLNDRRAVIIMNGTDTSLTIDMSIYSEILPAGTKLHDVVTGEDITIVPQMTFAPRALYILE